ncbi:hypothetical protein BDR26DRAFT_919328 [Obelidium mucronatum]|nr:hypothetical protein BDR26DRAFT_919328 [Obelidium mucronatum]
MRQHFKDTLTIKLVNAVFKPLYSNFSHLELCKITADTFEERVGPVNYKNTWLLRDKNHVDYALADQMLKAGVVSTRALGKILGYPVSHDLEMSCDVEYMYGPHQSACALEYQANLHADGARMVDHFIQCETALKHVGLDIIFTLGGRGFKSDLMARIHALPSVERKRASISGIAYFINTSNREGMDGSLLLGDPALKSCRPFDVLAFMNVLENTSATSDKFVNQLCMAMVNPYVFDLVCVEMAAFDKVLVGKGEKGQLEAWIAQRRPLFPRFFV